MFFWGYCQVFIFCLTFAFTAYFFCIKVVVVVTIALPAKYNYWQFEVFGFLLCNNLIDSIYYEIEDVCRFLYIFCFFVVNDSYGREYCVDEIGFVVYYTFCLY